MWGTKTVVVTNQGQVKTARTKPDERKEQVCYLSLIKVWN